MAGMHFVGNTFSDSMVLILIPAAEIQRQAGTRYLTGKKKRKESK